MNTWEVLKQKMDDLSFAEDNYLLNAGWKRSCEHPDSCWRWERKINGRQYIMNKQDAVNLQMYIDEGCEKEDDEEVQS